MWLGWCAEDHAYKHALQQIPNVMQQFNATHSENNGDQHITRTTTHNPQCEKTPKDKEGEPGDGE